MTEAKYMTPDEKRRLVEMYEQRLCADKIAAALNRSKSNISRQIAKIKVYGPEAFLNNKPRRTAISAELRQQVLEDLLSHNLSYD